MLYKKFLTYCLISVTLVYCKPKDYRELKGFPVTYELEGTVGPDIFSELIGISHFDSLLIINKFNIPDNKKILSFYSLNSFDFLFERVNVGKGPNEISIPGFVRLKGNSLYIHDFVSKKLYELIVEELLLNEDTPFISTVDLDQDKFFIDYFPENSSLLSFTDRSSNDILISFIGQDGQYCPAMDIPDNVKAYPGIIDIETMQTMALFSYVKHPDVPLYALAYHLVDVLAIINKDGEVITKLYGPHFISQTPARGMMKRYEAYHSIKCDSEYIYCAFKGFELELSMTEMPLMASTINVFTWKGEPVASLKLDHTFQEFEIVPEYSKIITFSPENGKLVKYDMPNFKRSEL